MEVANYIIARYEPQSRPILLIASIAIVHGGRMFRQLIQGDTAVELTDFTIQGTSKNRGDPFLFKGRAMIVYVHYKDSPTGWASIREIQPAT